MGRYRRLAKSLADIGIICHGTIMPRVILRPEAGADGRPKRYGPYCQWTRKIAGRTVNLNLSKSRSNIYAAAISNHRRLERTLSQMRQLSLRILELTSTGVPKRKRSK